MKARVRQSKNKQSLSKEQTKKFIMKKKIARLKTTNEKSIKGNSSLCGYIFEIDIKKELNFEDAEHKDFENLNLIL